MTTQNKNIVSTHTITVEGEAVTAYRIKNDSNGNPRYVVHFPSLNVEMSDYGNIKGLTKFRQSWFGGGYVFQSYNIEDTVKRALDLVKHYYNPYAVNPSEKQVQAMERLAMRLERASGGGLASAFLSSSYFGHDSYCMVVNTSEYQNKGGYVVFNTFTNKAEFIGDSEV